MDELRIIDCRYPYEYKGGHIEGAENISSTGDLQKTFFQSPSEKRVVVVFHCEYSIQRAPQM